MAKRPLKAVYLIYEELAAVTSPPPSPVFRVGSKTRRGTQIREIVPTSNSSNFGPRRHNYAGYNLASGVSLLLKVW
jgi:hypothetical protein